MAQQRVNPTRMELLRLKKREGLARKGHKLLKEKRDGLMREFLSLVREVGELRRQVDEQLGEAMRHFNLAQGSMTDQAALILSLLGTPDTSAQVREKNVMGVRIPVFRSSAVVIQPYPFWETSAELDEAMARFKTVMPMLLDLAAKEKAAELLAQEIEKTRRRVNALEHVLIPQLKATSRYIRMRLEEQARAAVVTTMKVKQAISK